MQPSFSRFRPSTSKPPSTFVDGHDAAGQSGSTGQFARHVQDTDGHLVPALDLKAVVGSKVRRYLTANGPESNGTATLTVSRMLMHS
jgi:hypothetical protein